MPLYLPDTNVVSRNFQQRDDRLTAKMAAAFPQLRLAAIVLAELEYGASKSGIVRHRQRLDALLRLLPVETFTAEDAAQYGRLRSHLEKRGQLIGPHDMLIAAQALRLGAIVVTHNVREFSRVPGLRCEDWQAA